MTVAETSSGPLGTEELRLIDAYWRAANYLSVGQIYLRDNPLLREPLTLDHVKPRLLGHWGTTPGLNLLYAHMNRAIRRRDLSAIFVTGPGMAAPGWSPTPTSRARTRGLSAHRRERGGAAPAVSAVLVPGWRAVARCAGDARFDPRGWRARVLARARLRRGVRQPRTCSRCCVVGDGEAETGPLAASWHSNKFVNPARDGAVLPVLHLNGYKIANPTVLARIPQDELRGLLEGYGHSPRFVEGDEPEAVHQALAAALDASLDEIGRIQERARRGDLRRPALADDRAAYAQGLDRTEGGRRPAGRGHVPVPSGPARDAV